MSPERTDGARGSYRFDELVPGVGRLRKKSGALTLADHHQRVALIRKLRDGSFPRLDLLQGLHDGTLTMAELLEADSQHKIKALQLADIIGKRPLWDTVWSMLEGMHASPATVATYRKSWKALQASQALPPRARVRDLAQVNWRALEARWGRSGASWNQLRRAVSRTLSVLLGGKEHPMRSAVLKHFPRRQELERMPDLTPEEFKRALALMPRPLQGPVITILVTGMRKGEYERCGPEHLGRYEVIIPGSKTDESRQRIAVAPEFWGWVTASIPCPVSTWVLRREWAKALQAAGLPHLTLHDIRHLTGQWLHDAGTSLSNVAQVLRQKTVTMAFRYAKRKQRREDAQVFVGVLGVVPQVDPRVEVSRETRKA